MLSLPLLHWVLHFFPYLKITQSVMVHSADVYLKDLQFYDYRLVSTLGFTEENVEALAEKRRCPGGGGCHIGRGSL